MDGGRRVEKKMLQYVATILVHIRLANVPINVSSVPKATTVEKDFAAETSNVLEQVGKK